MTYLRPPQGRLHPAGIIDLFSRRVAGWSMSERIDRKTALDALRMALAHRQPQRGSIHHADRGSQYARRDYRQLLATKGALHKAHSVTLSAANGSRRPNPRPVP